MSNKFKVGDRVVFYESGYRLSGQVTRIDPLNKALQVATPSNSRYHLHEKQCRKLVKKERKEFFVIVDKAGVAVGVYNLLEHSREHKANIPGTRILKASKLGEVK